MELPNATVSLSLLKPSIKSQHHQTTPPLAPLFSTKRSLCFSLGRQTTPEDFGTKGYHVPLETPIKTKEDVLIH